MIRSPYSAITINGAETWTLRSHERQFLEVFEMRCLRAIKGVTRADRVQNIKIRENTFTPESITDVIRHRRRGWFGHVYRMQRQGSTVCWKVLPVIYRLIFQAIEFCFCKWRVQAIASPTDWTVSTLRITQLPKLVNNQGDGDRNGRTTTHAISATRSRAGSTGRTGP